MAEASQRERDNSLNCEAKELKPMVQKLENQKHECKNKDLVFKCYRCRDHHYLFTSDQELHKHYLSSAEHSLEYKHGSIIFCGDCGKYLEFFKVVDIKESRGYKHHHDRKTDIFFCGLENCYDENRPCFNCGKNFKYWPTSHIVFIEGLQFHNNNECSPYNEWESLNVEWGSC